MVVFAIEILAIPARWKEYLGSHHRAMLSRKVFCFRRFTVFSYTHVRYGLLRHIRLVICPAVVRAYILLRFRYQLTEEKDYRQPYATQLVVRAGRGHSSHIFGHAWYNCKPCSYNRGTNAPLASCLAPNPNKELTNSTYNSRILHKLKAPIIHTVIQMRNPVIASIDINTACRPFRLPRCVLRHTPLERRAPCHQMRVIRDCARIHNRIRQLGGQRYTAERNFIVWTAASCQWA